MSGATKCVDGFQLRSKREIQSAAIENPGTNSMHQFNLHRIHCDQLDKTLLNYTLNSQNMEQMAKEQDRETEKQAILSETESNRRQMLRYETGIQIPT